MFGVSQCVAHAAADQAFDISNWSDIVQLPPSVYKSGQACRVQRSLRVLSTMDTPSSHPGVL